MSTVLVSELEAGIRQITLNRPEKLNSMTPELIDELEAALARLEGDPSCRVVILTGAGRGFCSGHDLDDMAEGAIPEDRGRVQFGMEIQAKFANLTVNIRKARKPVIAAVNGPAAGGGFAIALAADTRICSESAKFNAAFIRLGFGGADVGVSYLLPRIVGPTLAFEMMLSGRLIDAAEAKSSGLVLRVVPDGELIPAALEIARGIARNAPFGVEMTKEVMWSNLDAPSLEAAIELENRNQILCLQTEDHREALSAFLEKRPGRFRNR